MINFAAHKTGLLALLQKLVEIESPSTEKAAVDRVGALVAEECRQLGAQVQVVENQHTGGHVVARWNCPPNAAANESVKNSLLLMHHMDTVFPLGTLAKMPFYSKEDKTYGPGVLDMKGGIAITLGGIRALQEVGRLPKRPIVALFTSDEEIGSGTSHDLILGLAREAALALVLESGLVDGAVKTWRKGVGSFRLQVQGRAAHAGGEHEKGRNAIRELAHQVLEVEKWSDYSLGTTLNVGVIRGGTAENVVPDEAEARGDIRVLNPAEAERIRAAFAALQPAFPDTRLSAEVLFDRPPMPFDATMQATFARAQAIAAEIGQELKAGGSGGGSDGNLIAPLGVPVLDGLGTVGADYHSEREWIYTQSLPERAALIAALIEKW